MQNHGYSPEYGGCNDIEDYSSDCFLVGYGYVPYQVLGELYCEEDALKYGTIFPELNKPYGVYGKEFNNCVVDQR